MHSDDHDSSRRKLIQGAAATFAAGMVLPGFTSTALSEAITLSPAARRCGARM